jgi:hypothetical protein
VAKTIINKYGYEVVSPSRCKSAITGKTLKVGDWVTPIANLNGTAKAKVGEKFQIKLMWKNKYQTVLEFHGTEVSAASVLFEKVAN